MAPVLKTGVGNHRGFESYRFRSKVPYSKGRERELKPHELCRFEPDRDYVQ